MKHRYELRKIERDGSVITVLKIESEPKNAKKKAKEYADENPGIYSLKKIDTIAMYFTEKGD